MLFNSVPFLIFFPVVTYLYFITPPKGRLWLLLLASCIFYMAFSPIYILLLAAIILVDYLSAILISQTAGTKRKLFLLVSIIANVGVLVIFKYLNFITETIFWISAQLGWSHTYQFFAILLPLGLSFHTFQAMSYTIDVYRKRAAVEKSLLIYALYVMFYPQLVAGPIERPGHLIPQFKQNHIFDYERVSGGLKRMLWGFFKKIVIADRLAVLVNQIYNQPHEYAGIPLILATWFFTYQIYCDFSAYTDIALGAAQVMGFRLMENFRLPFSATTIIDFWNRWHISLSSWFRDYVYLPLGISAKWHWSLVVLVVFALSGIWHGAGWTFVVWGLLHGIFIIATIITRKYGNRLAILTGLKAHPSIQKSLQIILTFQLVSFAFIFFRAQTLADAWYIVTHLLSHIPTQLQDFMRTLDYTKAWGPLGLDRRELVIAVAAIVLLEEVQHQFETSRITNIFREKPLAIRWGFYYALILGIIFFTSFSSQRFIYFQF